MNPLYLSRAVLISYDGEEPPAGAPVPSPSPTPAGFDFSGFTVEQQNKVNALLAADRRKHVAQKEAILAEAASKTSLSAEDRASLEQQLAEVRASHQSAEQRAAAEKKQLEERYKKELASEKKAREDWETRYKQGTVERALQDAAIQGEAFNTETMMAVLRPVTRLTEITDEKTGKGTGKFKVMVDFPDNDPETGECRQADEGHPQVQQSFQVRCRGGCRRQLRGADRRQRQARRAEADAGTVYGDQGEKP